MPSRFFEGFQWRFLFADIPAPDAVVPSPGGITTTWADGLLTNRQITKTLNQPTVITADVWPDDRRVNAIFNDGNPLVAQSNRILYAFRRENPTSVGTGTRQPWVCRAAGIVMSPEDQGDADVPLTHIAAYDAWQYLAGRPCMTAAGDLGSAYGIRWIAVPGGEIVAQLLKNTITNEGFAFVDAGVSWGGTPYWGGTIEATDPINFVTQQGTMVGDAWTQLCDTGGLDIVLTPIYDPTRRPGYTHELSVYRLAGSEKPSAVFGWDKMGRGASTIDRMHDGTPPNFSNKILYYVGQGGPPPAMQTNAESVNAFGAQWATQFFPQQTIPLSDTVLALMKQALTMSKQGQRTMTIDATPQRSPVPLTEYDVGDRVPIYASKNLRVTAAGYQRVQAIPITVTDDGIERVSALLCSPDWRTVT